MKSELKILRANTKQLAESNEYVGKYFTALKKMSNPYRPGRQRWTDRSTALAAVSFALGAFAMILLGVLTGVIRLPWRGPTL